MGRNNKRARTGYRMNCRLGRGIQHEWVIKCDTAGVLVSGRMYSIIFLIFATHARIPTHTVQKLHCFSSHKTLDYIGEVQFVKIRKHFPYAPCIFPLHFTAPSHFLSHFFFFFIFFSGPWVFDPPFAVTYPYYKTSRMLILILLSSSSIYYHILLC